MANDPNYAERMADDADTYGSGGGGGGSSGKQKKIGPPPIMGSGLKRPQGSKAGKLEKKQVVTSAKAVADASLAIKELASELKKKNEVSKFTTRLNALAQQAEIYRSLGNQEALARIAAKMEEVTDKMEEAQERQVVVGETVATTASGLTDSANTSNNTNNHNPPNIVAITNPPNDDDSQPSAAANALFTDTTQEI